MSLLSATGVFLCLSSLNNPTPHPRQLSLVEVPYKDLSTRQSSEGSGVEW